ncbi:tyrosine-type recombinase/integrase [Bradyrhizobium sp. AC87j1]|uniref:tyrosine-type recombinase/integrase n=1 Tax=Bradyrhizobium sp. AC87j1 TaxID=2055894 RepID=UPI001FDEBD98|nr:tyrosine-type recombinase/integrase [Bradyrhizobium sp. AC87j1]
MVAVRADSRYPDPKAGGEVDWLENLPPGWAARRQSDCRRQEGEAETTGHRTWTEDHITKIREHHKVGTPLRLAMELLLNTGLRRSEAVRLGWKHLTKDGFVISTKKSQGTLSCAFRCTPTGALHDGLPEGWPGLHCNHSRPSAQQKAFSAWISEAAADAGLPPRSFPHGVQQGCVPWLG